MEQQPQRKEINPKFIFNEQQVAIFDLTSENIRLKAYIGQLEEEKAKLQEQLTEAKKPSK
ncbi:hypothetical protein BCP8-2_218 [Bacillus phage BCP8-2]|uniref:Uncharacterized protein n=1 Tax=Bacillus phage BCP8-2 TaxID=1129192 RepID=A0A0E3D9P1_9CAUD|nr:hypothetical protein BCP8-2_218 [Bacillus phage BCP8-2]AHJ87256.1 hypothetical protein BCP8-2_218 [Bacillus phage BCP8-2]